jgi:RNA polymerase sigma-70 factor (ECF subfamily)
MVHAPEPIVPEDDIARLSLALHRYFSRRAQPPEVEDLVQETFVQLHKRRTGAVISDLNRYVFTVAGNVLMRRHKRERRWQRGFQAEVWDIQEPASPEHSLMGKQELDAVVATLERLPPRTREVFLLQRFQEMTYSDVARNLGISVSAVEKHMIRALKALNDLELDL